MDEEDIINSIIENKLRTTWRLLKESRNNRFDQKRNNRFLSI